MDPFTHGLVGAAAAQLVTPVERNRDMALAGFASAMLADADVFLRRADDPLFQLELHRQFSHSLLFIPVGAAIAVGLLWWFLRSRLGLCSLYLACLAGYATAGVVDACTSFGTQLLWPFSTVRVAWSIVPVVDPVLTMGLLVLVIASLRTRSIVWAKWALGWLGLVLLYGGLQKERAWRAAHGLQLSRGHVVAQCVVKPTLGNQLVWRATYIHDGRVYADGIRTSLFETPLLYPGGVAPLVVVERDFAALEGTPTFRGLERFSELSEGYLIMHPDAPNVVGDARYAMLPTSVSPLWGVEFDPSQPAGPLKFLTYRENSEQVRDDFLVMLLGRHPSGLQKISE